MLTTFFQELRRRRAFRTAGLYIVGSWLVLQVADLFFPAWGLPDSALNVLLIMAVLGFPIALIFGWLFDITDAGIVRTPPLEANAESPPQALRGKDYVILAALAGIFVIIALGGVRDLLRLPTEPAFVNAEVSGNTIAVLPFANLTTDPENDAFCDGVAAEILHKLSAASGLRVLGQTSSFAFKGTDYSASNIARTVGAAYLLQGSVRRDGDDVRIVAALVDKDGVQQWTQAFDRRMEGIFAIQSEIAELVSATVAPKVAFEAEPSYEPDLYVYQTYLSGRELLRKRDVRAFDLLAKAIRLDPDYAAAQAELAIATMVRYTNARDYGAARVAIDAALALQPGLPRALAARGLWLFEGPERDLVRAEENLRAAIAADPAMVDAMNWLGSVLAEDGQYAEELAVREQAAAIDPLHGVLGINLAFMYANRGRFDEAETNLLRGLELPNPTLRSYVTLREFYHQTGQIAKMIAIEKAAAERRDHTYYGLAFGYALLEDWELTRYWVERSRQDLPDFPYIGYGLYEALLPIWQGDHTGALSLLENGIAGNPAKAEAMQPATASYLGIRQALAGRFPEAVVTLEPLRENGLRFGDDRQDDAAIALAWAYGQTGDDQRKAAVLAEFDAHYAQLNDARLLNNSQDLYRYSLCALLQGENASALDRLEQAIDVGWRDLILIRHDPRWDELRDDPRYKRLLEKVDVELAAERAQVKAIDARVDFVADFERRFGEKL